MGDFIVRPPIWQFAFLEFSYLLLSSASAASIAPIAISIANVAYTTGQYTRIRIHIHIHVHNRVRIHIRTHISIHTRIHGDVALAVYI